MSVAAGYTAAAWGVVKRDLLLFVSYRGRVVAHILTALFTITLFYYISRMIRISAFSTPDEYFAFVVVGLAILGALASTLTGAPMLIRQELVAGTFERLVISPFGALASLLSLLAFPLLLALFTGFVTLVLAALVYDLPLQATAPIALPVAVLGALAFAPFGILLAAALLVLKQALAAGRFILAGITIIAGFYFPVALLPDWIEWASYVQPFTPAVDVLRHLLVDTPLREPLWAELAKLAGFALVLIPGSVLVLVLAVETSRRRGTIVEY